MSKNVPRSLRPIARAWQSAAIEEGIKAADEGRVVDHEEVAAWVQSWGRSDELAMPKCG